MTNFVFGERSRSELQGVRAELVRVCELALSRTPVDFGVHDGLRTLEQQREYVRTGVSRTMDSAHLHGQAVDLVPYINGRLRWEWPPIYLIAETVRDAALELGVELRWGGCWDRVLTQEPDDPETLVIEYGNRRRQAGRAAFLDGPHYELYGQIA